MAVNVRAQTEARASSAHTASLGVRVTSRVIERTGITPRAAMALRTAARSMARPVPAFFVHPMLGVVARTRAKANMTPVSHPILRVQAKSTMRARWARFVAGVRRPFQRMGHYIGLRVGS